MEGVGVEGGGDEGGGDEGGGDEGRGRGRNHSYVPGVKHAHCGIQLESVQNMNTFRRRPKMPAPTTPKKAKTVSQQPRT